MKECLKIIKEMVKEYYKNSNKLYEGEWKDDKEMVKEYSNNVIIRKGSNYIL
jgi:hypothetical protein